jgi:DNA-binding NtrC family response regulator
MMHDVADDGQASAEQELRATLARVDAVASSGLVGSSSSWVRVIGQLPALAAGEAPVLVSGETGTGKELVARAVHYLSPRAAYPFLPVNCGALPDTLLEDELFGHERGAFTDARTRRVGLIPQAERGTVFLDEVDSLSPRGQVALLRVLQEKTVRPLGGGREQRVDVRFVAATNAPLLQRVHAGAFRADLYYRLCVLSVELPPLRDRRDDVFLIAQHLLRRSLPLGRGPLRFSAASVAAMLSAHWPGNVRELENAVIRAVHLARHGVIEPGDLGLAPAAPGLAPSPSAVLAPLASEAEHSADLPPFQQAKQRAIDSWEREYLLRSMAEHGGNVSHAARAAGKERREFGKLLKKHALNPRAFQAANR